MNSTVTVVEFKKNLPRHLFELEQLVGRRVQPEDLLSLEVTELIRARAKKIERAPSWKCEIQFADKLNSRFQVLVRTLEDMHSVPVYAWTPLSNICGLLRPVRLAEVNFGFDFSLNTNGIFVLLGEDLLDQMVLDYSENGLNQQILEIEVSGEHWGHAQY